ncbi:MAG: hypothetical protein IT385_27005 [Deltaproteobacteria bacterium]|nr:hypothetical protein [Deltaproteobacteria bacterium]
MAKHVLTKLDGKALLAEGERTQQSYKLKPSWRRMIIFAGVLCCLLVILIPLGIWLIIAAGKARLAIGEEGFAFKLYGTRTYAWKDIEAITPGAIGAAAMGGGLVGVALASAVSARTEGLRGPLFIKLKGHKWPGQIPAHWIADSVAMAREMERRSGLTIFPPEPAAK